MKTLPLRIRNLRSSAAAAAATAIFPALSAGQAAPPRVLVVHGIWDTSRTLRQMAEAIRSSGAETLSVQLSPNDGSVSLDTLARQAHEDVERAFGKDAALSIVGFSMGGLVARSYLRQFGQPGKIPAVITIASPHHGTLTAFLNGKTGIRDMRPGSPFLLALENDHLRFPETRWITIRTPLDLMIVPSTSSALPWAKNLVVPALAHPLLGRDSRVIARVLRELGLPAHPAALPTNSRRAGSLARRIPGIRPAQKPSADPR